MHSSNRSGAAGASASRPSLLALAAVVALAATALLIVHPSPGHAAKASGPAVSTESTSLGRILVDAHGHTLYLFGKDTNGKSACSGQCATFWPPLIASGTPRALGGVQSSLLGTTKRADGRMQVTYNHHPLYTFLKDTKKGQTNGQKVNAFGALWYVVSQAGNKITKAAH